MKRYGQIIRVVPEKLEHYKKLHANPWAEVLETITKCNIKNYSIYYLNGYLFAYFEYYGKDFEKDMATMASDPITQQWWEECEPCQKPLDDTNEDEWWTNMEEIFHYD